MVLTCTKLHLIDNGVTLRFDLGLTSLWEWPCYKAGRWSIYRARISPCLLKLVKKWGYFDQVSHDKDISCDNSGGSFFKSARVAFRVLAQRIFGT